MTKAVARRDRNMFNNEQPSFCKPRTQPLEVMIVGLSRTGTTSMLEAMRELGYGDIWNSREMIRQHQAAFCGAMLETKMRGYGQPYGLEQFESVFGEFRCISGEFVATMADDLIRAYPDAQVILTVRSDEERWLHSFTSTLWYNYSTWAHWFLRKVDRNWGQQAAFLDPFYHQFFAGNPLVHGLRVYREHNAMVRRLVEPKERLLVYDTEQGWGPLCEFLGKDVPAAAFPHANRATEHRELFGRARGAALRSWAARFVLLGSLPTAAITLFLLRKHRGGLL